MYSNSIVCLWGCAITLAALCIFLGWLLIKDIKSTTSEITPAVCACGYCDAVCESLTVSHNEVIALHKELNVSMVKYARCRLDFGALQDKFNEEAEERRLCEFYRSDSRIKNNK